MVADAAQSENREREAAVEPVQDDRPTKTKMSGSANGAKASFAGATRSTTAAATPSKAVIAIGIASVTQSTTTATNTAARR
jgi:hypothetical protein